MIDWMLHVLLLGLVVLALPAMLSAVRVKHYGIALLVAVVYGFVNATLGVALAFLTLPLVFLTLGLFKLVINSFLLWLTDKLIAGFEIRGFGATFAAAVIVTVADALIEWAL